MKEKAFVPGLIKLYRDQLNNKKGGRKMENNQESIKLKLDSPKISSKKFIQGIEAFFGILEGITNDLYGSKKAIPWSVRVKPGCAEIEAVPEPTDDPKVKPSVVNETLRRGLRVVEDKPERPEHFADETLEKIRNLAKLSDPKGLRVSIMSGGEQQEISPTTGANINEILRWKHSAIGTIEGQLQILAKRKGYEIEIRDEVSGRLVHCFIPKEMLEDAKEAFDRRVAVTGKIRYRGDGIPLSIEVTKLFRFPLNRELPHHNDVRGIFGEPN